MIEARIIEISTGEVVRAIPLRDVITTDDARVDKIERGLMRNMDLDRYSVLTVDTEQADADRS